MNFRSSVGFEDGVKAGNSVLNLISEITPALRETCEVSTPEEQLNPIFDWIEEFGGKKFEYLEGFLSRIIKPQEVEGEIVTLWGADEFIKNQTQYAPICNIPTSAKIFQFGYWGGDLCDGDGWCIDLQEENVICVCVTGGYDDPNQVRQEAYGVMPKLNYFSAWLRASAEDRGWLEKNRG